MGVNELIASRQTVLSPCRTWRYALWREFGGLFDDGSYVLFIGLNPSTADEKSDDQTIRTCVAFAKSWGMSSLCMANLFAFRARDPAIMKAAADPIGPDNDAFLVGLARNASLIVAAWGNDGEHLGRDRIVRAMIPNLLCLKVTGTGQPHHPLYLPSDLTPIALP
jgi:hypothetical protein